jgi:hypothetical protein
MYLEALVRRIKAREIPWPDDLGRERQHAERTARRAPASVFLVSLVLRLAAVDRPLNIDSLVDPARRRLRVRPGPGRPVGNLHATASA